MDLDEIRKIIELMNEHDLSFFHLRRGDVNIKLRKGMDLDEIIPLLQMQQRPAGFQALPTGDVGSATGPGGEKAAVGSEAPEPEVDNEIEVPSPMVGTFYRAASPEAPPFVKVGTEIDEGTTVCIIEAMKVMNEIKPEGLHGVITRVLVDDGTPVQFGQPLFKLKAQS